MYHALGSNVLPQFSPGSFLVGLLLIAPALPGAATPAFANARRIAAAPDTAYSLAVDSAAFPDFAFVYLLNEGTARLEASGRGVRTFHQIVQVLRPAGVNQWAERSMSYRPDREKLTVNWMRVVRPSGEVISDKPAQSQASDVPASVDNPVYTETKVLRFSLSNVAPGTIVDLNWTVEATEPAMPGDFLAQWSISAPAPEMRAHFLLDLPSSVTPRLQERFLDFPRTELVTGGRHIMEWKRDNLLPPRNEIFAPDSTIHVMTVRASAPVTWNDVGKWYNDLAKDRYVLTPRVTKAVDSVVKSSRTAADTINALHRWIAKDLRYVSIALGIGGYQPRTPDATLSTGYGDCKDKATLFVAAARHLGIEAYPVLLSNVGGVVSELPAVEQFNHVIAAFQKRGAASLTFLDLTTFAFAPGESPPQYQGSFGLVVLRDGTTRSVTFPFSGPGSLQQSFVGSLDSTGHLSGLLTVSAHGAAESSMRAAYADTPDAARLDLLKRTVPRPFPGILVDSLFLFDPKDFTRSPSIDIAMHGGEAAKPAGKLMIFSIPQPFRGPVTAYRQLLDELARAGQRTLPIDANRVAGALGTRSELRILLPVGWTAQLPPSVHTEGPFGSYDAEYSQVGREMHVVHSIMGTRTVQPANRVAALVEWLQKVVKDDAEFIPITTQ